MRNGYRNQATNQADNQAAKDVVDQVRGIMEEEIHAKVGNIIEYSRIWIKRKDLFKRLEMTSQSAHRKKYIDPLLEVEWLEMEFPDRPTHPSQRYKITPAGERILAILKS